MSSIVDLHSFFVLISSVKIIAQNSPPLNEKKRRISGKKKKVKRLVLRILTLK